MKGYDGWFEPNKVFAIEGGSMAWVDLREGILLCDSVAEEEHPEVRLIQLPPLMPINDGYGLGVDSYSYGYYHRLPSLDSSRDVTYSNGWFRSIEVGFQLPLLDGAKQLNVQWTANMFRMMVSSKDCQWEQYGTANSVELSPAASCFPDLFPEIWCPKDNKLTLSNVVTGLHPTLDVYNEDMVYMIAKIWGTDPGGWVLAVDTANKKLEKISPFREESFHFPRIYLQCQFSRHLSMAPGSQLTHDLDKCTNRKKIELLEANLLAALNQLRTIETRVATLNSSYDGKMPLFFTGAASHLKQNTHKDVEDGLNNDEGTNADCDCLRLMGDLRLQLLASIGEIISKIKVAHGALYDLV